MNQVLKFNVYQRLKEGDVEEEKRRNEENNE